MSRFCLREILQLITWHCDPRLRCGWQPDRDARTQGQLQRMVTWLCRQSRRFESDRSVRTSWRRWRRRSRPGTDF